MPLMTEEGVSHLRVRSAISMVVTLHWRAHSLSIDLTSDEISATGGHQRFALERFALLVSIRKRTRTADGIPVPRTARVRTPGRFLLYRIAHWATASFTPQPCVIYCRCRDGILRKAKDVIEMRTQDDKLAMTFLPEIVNNVFNQ